MYGKEEHTIRTQCGGENVVVNNATQQQQEKVFKKILSPEPIMVKSSILNEEKSPFLHGKSMKLIILIFFFFIFRGILSKIHDFFDIDDVYSNTMIAWLGVIILLWVALPNDLSSLKKTEAEKQMYKLRKSSKGFMTYFTFGFITLAIITGIVL